MKISNKIKVLKQINKTILPSGIKVLTENIPYVKSFSLGFWLNVGSRDESFKNNGISHFIEHMLFKGTKKRSARRIATEIESLGGYLNAFTSKEHTCYYGRGLSEHLRKTFDVISDMIQFPAFKPSEIKKEAGVVIDELNDIEDNPEELIFDKFEEIIFSGRSLSLPIIGSEKNINSFNQDSLFHFVNENYGFNKLIVAASGNLDHNKILKLVDTYIQKDLGKSNVKRKHSSAANLPGKIEIIDKEIQQVHAIMGRSAVGFKSEDRQKIAVLSQVLGEGSSSRLFQAVREKNGIAYQVNSFLNSYYDVSAFGIYFSTNDKMTDRAISIILRELKKLREIKISERELKKAKEAIKGNILLSLENTTSRMIRMAQSELYYNRMIPVEEVIKKIDSVSREDILKLANELLDEDTFIKIIIKSKNTKLKTAA